MHMAWLARTRFSYLKRDKDMLTPPDQTGPSVRFTSAVSLDRTVQINVYDSGILYDEGREVRGGVGRWMAMIASRFLSV